MKLCFQPFCCCFSLQLHVPMGSPSHGGDVTVYVYDINQLSLPTPFYSVHVSVSVFVALSTVFHSINSPDNSPFSHSVLPAFSALFVLSTMCLFMKISFSPDVIPSGCLCSKHQLTNSSHTINREPENLSWHCNIR